MEVVSALLGIARLHFSLYLIHSVYIRWYWSEARLLQTFGFWAIVSIGLINFRKINFLYWLTTHV